MSKNRLQHETSPYLLQHAVNPVDWYAWNEEALRAAKQQNKPIFLSIGYSTCYWCHMMEKDSFERQEVAELLNRSFISIKVDREERPDLDHAYMEAVSALTGRGGWPLSVFLTPDLKPFWGGTFFRRSDFMHILERIGETWQTSPEEINESAKQICLALEEDKASLSDDLPDQRIIDWTLRNFEETFDRDHGGFGEAPKFPPAMQVSLLLRLHRRTGNETAIEMAVTTLKHMAAGGIYDHLAGGFSRYSTDERWLVPHFEKMLYDNALLAWTYTEAWQLTAEQMFSDVAKETLDYLLREMRSPEGGFYAAQDAGEAGREGECYVWQYEEARNLLSPGEFEDFQRLFSLTERGNFEHSANILSLNDTALWGESRRADRKSLLKRLYQARCESGRPSRDDKIITGWNALTISSLSLAARAFKQTSYLEAAEQAAFFLLDRLYVDGRLLRIYCRGKAGIDACSEDYAFLIDALLNLYQADFNPAHLLKAAELQRLQNELFWDSVRGGYYISAAPDLFRRRKDLQDGAVPSANSVSFHNLQRLEKIFPQDGFDVFRLGTLRTLALNLQRFPQALPRAMWSFDPAQTCARELVISCGQSPHQASGALLDINTRFNPDLYVCLISPATSTEWKQVPLLSGKPASAAALYYLCRNSTCETPKEEWDSSLLA